MAEEETAFVVWKSLIEPEVFLGQETDLQFHSEGLES